MSDREASGDSEYDSRKYGSIWTRRFSYDEMNKRVATKRTPRRRLSSVELGRRLSMVGYLEPTVVDIHESDDDDVPEIDHSGPIHSMRRPIPPKYGGLPNYKDLLGNEDEGAGDTGGATGRLLPQITKKSPRMSDDTGGATRRLLPQITKKSPRRSDDIGGATGRLLPPIMKNSPRRYKRYRQYRLMTYRQFINWVRRGQLLGKKFRVVIPACVVLKIRKTFPEPSGEYEGYHSASDSDLD